MSQAPEEAPAEARQDGASRLKAALVHPSRHQLIVGALMLVLGAGAVLQVRLVNSDDDYSGMRQPELIQVLNGLNAAARRNERALEELERTRDGLRSQTAKRQTALEQAREELTTLGILAGTLPATGPGLRVTVEMPEDEALTTNQLLDGLEELRDAGAEAIEINDSVRVIAQTSLQDTIEGLEIDGALLRPPYVIDVIGDPETLETALGVPGGFKDDIGTSGEVEVERLDDVEVTVLRTPTEPRFAQPLEDQ